MANPEWGTKRICLSCSARFYDLGREPIICPSCGATFDPQANTRPRRARAAIKPVVEQETVESASEDEDEIEVAAEDTEVEEAEETETENEDEPDAAIEDVSELGDDDMSDVIDTEMDDETDSDR